MPIYRYTLQLPSFGIPALQKVDKQDTSVIKKLEDSLRIELKSSIDSVALQRKMDSLQRITKKFQSAQKTKGSLNNFFKALEHAKKKKVRIMHYGDSQIEADRITSYLRNELQKKFGGYGVGLFPVVSVAKKMSVNIETSDNWVRYAGFGKKDTTIKHNKYGPLMSFCQFNVAQNPEDSATQKAWIKIRKPKASYGKTKTYHLLKLFLANNAQNLHYEINDGEDTVSGDVPAYTPFEVLTVNFKRTPEEINITFIGKESPDIYGISLEGRNGVVMDNIPLRGSSGTIFSKQNKTLLGNVYANLSPELIILEFGGNVLPYLKTEEKCITYGRWFKSQIHQLKKMNPTASFIVVGPADMSVKEKISYVTHPLLECVRDALREAALSSGCIFWDMYEVMGGKNSMPKWVNSDPALATTDYIHFTSKGAKKIAEKFYEELMLQYKNYQNEKTSKSDTLVEQKK